MLIILTAFIIASIFAFAIEKSEDESQKNILTIICLSYLALISGTRLCGGTDFPIYEGMYDNVPRLNNFFNPEFTKPNYEFGYVFTISFFKTLGVSFYGFCLIHSAIFYFCMYKGLKRFTNHMGLVILVFLYKLFFYDTMISMRQALTIAFFFLMLPLIQEKKLVKYYFWALIVSQFHNGAYLLFLLYPLAYIKLSKRRIIILNLIFIPTIIIGFAGIDVLGPVGEFLADNAANERMAEKAEDYFSNDNTSAIAIMHTLEYFLIMFLFLFNINKINLNNSKIHTSIWMFLCLLPLFTLFRGSEILTREKDYFTIFYAVIIGYLINALPRTRWMYYMGVFLICAFGYYRFVILFDDGAFLFYKSWLFEPYYSFMLPPAVY